MKYHHHELEFEIEDGWLIEAGAIGFKTAQECYLSNCAGISESDVFVVRIDSVEPALERAKARGVICDDGESGEPAKQRVIRILRWFISNQEIEPVKVVFSKSNTYRYKLVAGSHRFHCAIAMGFKCVPATMGFDINDPYA